MFVVNRNPSEGELRKFGLTILAGLAVIGGLLWYLGRPDVEEAGLSGAQIAAVVLWIVGALVAVLAVPPTGLARYVYVGWMTAAMAVGMVVTPVLFTVLFIVVLPVFSLIRLKDPLRLRRGERDTYWQDASPHEATLERVARPF